ncbi:MAG: PEP-CTERM/exosortase system-associated acyltransferase [Desulforegulaceae bacterium]|nr:PEP-CTERM/exosortase system-associated acyltransferase [Desulforegulaceae bacterium]
MIKNSQQYGNFRFGIVDDENIKKDTFKMRYEVYVEEFGFEKKDDHQDGLETDEFENEAIHIACLNKSDSVVGTIRLVLNSPKGFPIEAIPNLTFVRKKPDKDKIAEVSRLTVSKDLRRRKEDGAYGIESYLTKKEGGILPDDGKIPKEMLGRKNPIIILGLCQIMYHESKRNGITHWYMITEDKLFFALRKYGFIFHPIGEKIFYHGWRTPYLGIVDEIEKELYRIDPNMFEVMMNGLEPEFYPDFYKKIKGL